MPRALAGLRETLDAGRRAGNVAAKRQTIAAADQCATWATNRWFDSVADEAAARTDLPAELLEQIRDRAGNANSAYGELASYLRDEYAPDADEHDGCGPERYRVGVRAMLGADLDPQEMYD